MNILVVRKHNQIGDMLCSLPLFKALKKKYPESSITLVASPTNYPIPFKKINPFIQFRRNYKLNHQNKFLKVFEAIGAIGAFEDNYIFFIRGSDTQTHK